MDTINWHSVFFLFFGLLSSLFAVAVVATPNVVRMALYLIVSLAATSGLFFLAGADFVGAMQLMIYVGGTLVLLIFGVMLTAQGPFVSLRSSGGDWVASALIAGLLLAVLAPAAIAIKDWHAPLGRAASEAPAAPGAKVTAIDSAVRPTATRLGMGLLGHRVDRLDDVASPLNQGKSGYLLPFEVISVHLLVVLVGAAYLARSKRRAA